MGLKSTAARLGVSVEQLRAYRRRGMKHCWDCQRWLPAGRFNSDASRHDGKEASCRMCKSQRYHAARNNTPSCCPHCGSALDEE